MNGKSRQRTRLVCVFIMVFALLSTFVGIAQDQLQLGNMTYSRAAAPALRMPVTGSVRFFRAVGGVAFSAVAEGIDGLTVASLRYDAAAEDGRRLVITVRSRAGELATVRGDIFDWQLVPTARFALDENGSAVTLFGRLNDEELAEQLTSAGHRIVNYHPQLDNTLLGLRLLQADMLIIRPEASDLFKRSGKPILGAGESGHDYSKNLSRFDQVARWQKEQADQGSHYQSYVVGDLGQRVTFAARDRGLVFGGEPFWHAWRAKYRTAADEMNRQRLAARFEEKREAYNAALRAASNSATAERLRMLDAELDGIEREFTELSAIEAMPAYSRSLTSQIQAVDGINPLVFQAVTTVMHYRALFKHYQSRNSSGFASFVKALDGVSVRPAVSTPTIQRTAHSSR